MSRRHRRNVGDVFAPSSAPVTMIQAKAPRRYVANVRVLADGAEYKPGDELPESATRGLYEGRQYRVEE